MLKTAKIQSGNSGGPVINRSGAIVGVSVKSPEGERSYVYLGYGMALSSSSYLLEILNNLIILEDKIKYYNFPDS